MTTTTDTAPTDQRFSPGLQVRDFQIRSVNTDTREVTGIAVPWDDEIRIEGWFEDYFESVARGACEARDGEPKLFWLHRAAIGKVTSHRDTDDGWEITARISQTPTGDEAYTLLRDGVIDRMSIGFTPIEHTVTKDDEGRQHITRTRIEVREVSLVPFPAYDGATVTDVRHAPTKENRTMPETMTAPDADLREAVEDLTRSVELLRSHNQNPPAGPTLRYRSAGELLKAIARGDEDALNEYNTVQARAWNPEGTTTDDTVTKDAWVGDLTRLVDEKAGIQNLFSTGTLPSEGNNIEYGVLDTDTTQVTEQSDEGDDLAFGLVEIGTATAPVKTYGGYTRLSFQAIQRSSVATLDHHIRALTLAANRRRGAAFRAHYAAAVTAQTTAGNTVEVTDPTDYIDWVSAIIDAAEKYEDLGLDLEALTADKTVFKQLAQLTATDGRPLMTVYGSGTNVVGEINPKGISGNLAGVTVAVNLKQAAPGAAFTNRLAIRAYRSPLARLQDDNIINLSRDVSVYYYEALANEVPAAIVPVTLGDDG